MWLLPLLLCPVVIRGEQKQRQYCEGDATACKNAERRKELQT